MFEAYLEVAQEAARAAGAIQVAGLRQAQPLRVETKSSPVDLVTEIDRACEAEIARLIASRFPDHRLLAEEGTTGGSDPDFCWIVDPLDGTTNYTHGHPFFCASVALEYREQIVAGAVYDAMRDELFWATAGGGAYLNGERINVSSVSDLGKALVASGYPGDQAANPPIMVGWERLALHSHGIRRDGSAALSLCYVACGRLDGFWERLNAWDMAAGALLVSEAGGTVTNFAGSPFDLYRREILVASHPNVSAAVVRLL